MASDVLKAFDDGDSDVGNGLDSTRSLGPVSEVGSHAEAQPAKAEPAVTEAGTEARAVGGPLRPESPNRGRPPNPMATAAAAAVAARATASAAAAAAGGGAGTGTVAPRAAALLAAAQPGLGSPGLGSPGLGPALDTDTGLNSIDTGVDEIDEEDIPEEEHESTDGEDTEYGDGDTFRSGGGAGRTRAW